MHKIIFPIISFFLLNFSAQAVVIKEKRRIIAIIDSGISLFQSRQPYMCKNGLVTTYNDDGLDEMGHGTNITSLISPSIDAKTTCLVSIKVVSLRNNAINNNISNYLKALEFATFIKPRFLNVSMSGNYNSKTEYDFFIKMLKNGTIISVAAGNEHNDLSINCIAFPACYRPLIPKKLKDNYNVVGSLTTNSNFGDVVNVYLDGKEKGYPVKSGSSQATAMMTAQLVIKQK